MEIVIVERHNNGRETRFEMTEDQFREYAEAMRPDEDWTGDIIDAADLFGELVSNPARQTTTVYVNAQ